MAQLIETGQDACAPLQKAFKLGGAPIGDILPNDVGVSLWQQWSLDNVRGDLWATWTDSDLGARDRSSKNSRANLDAQDGYDDERARASESGLEKCDDEDLVVITEHEAHAAQDAEDANRKWAACIRMQRNNNLVAP